MINTKDESNQDSRASSVSTLYEFSESGLRRNRIVILMIAVCLGFATFPSYAMNMFFMEDLHLEPA
jgi:hypothetical protein